MTTLMTAVRIRILMMAVRINKTHGDGQEGKSIKPAALSGRGSLT
jgi:hypothetical protein